MEDFLSFLPVWERNSGAEGKMTQQKSRVWLWVLLAVLFVLIVGGVVYYFKFSKKTGTPAAVPSTAITVSPTTQVTDSGVTWITPQVLGDLAIIKTGIDTSGIASVKYYKIADLADGGELVLAQLEFEGPAMNVMYIFKKDSAGKYAYLSQLSTEKDLGVVKLVLADGVNIDEATVYKALLPPETLTIQNTILKSANNVGWFSELKNPQAVADTAYGKMYQTLSREDVTDVGGIVFVLKLVNSTYRNYVIKPAFMTDDEVAQVTWSDGTKNSAKYTSESYTGCGTTSANNAIIDTKNIDSRLIEMGKTSTGDTVYTVSKDDPAMKAAYENYKIGREKYLTIEEFSTQKPLFIWKSGLGKYIIYTGRDFAGLAECGKPVIYLYPETPTQFSLKVDAKITQSEPLYQNGWQGIAYPSGKLNVLGKIYDYLFWEGTGKDYPIIDAGIVVRYQDVKSTIEKQLGELGLNPKEIADFEEFWLSKMPKTPYVRLTWFGTNIMNKLAPLSVSPSPDTLIRVFLDFEGLNAPISLLPQRLTAPERRGFTVVEWGGLLR